MLEIFYEDPEIIVVKKPAGMESQARHSFEPDMVSEIRNHIRSEIRSHIRETAAADQKSHRISTSAAEPYVGVIHRLDKPVSGIMVYAKTKEAAAELSAQIQAGRMKKTYRAVVCGRCVDNVGNFVDYLLKDPCKNRSMIVEKGINGAKRAELRYRVLGVRDNPLGKTADPEENAAPLGKTADPEEKTGALAPVENAELLTLVEIELLTGRHHQIRVQFSGHGLPLWGDTRYGAGARPAQPAQSPRSAQPAPSVQPVPSARLAQPAQPEQPALCACGLTFLHPSTGQTMTFSMKPDHPAFALFENAGQ